MSADNPSSMRYEAEPTDTERLDWVMDILSLGNDAEVGRKTILIAQVLIKGKQGREAIDAAMRGEV